MKMEIGTKIAALRHKRGVTQEQLAAAIGVSAPAVSKWETGQSYPDIALLPPLARYFDVTVDALLAYAPELTEEEQEAAYKRINETFANEGWEAGLAACDALLREYPTDMMLRVLLVSSLMQSLIFAKDDAQRNEGRDRQIRWMQEAAQSGDVKLQLSAKHMLAGFYLQRKRPDDAEPLLNELSELQLGSDQMMPRLRMLQDRYDDAMHLAQRSLYSALMEGINALSTMTAIALHEKETEKAMLYANATAALPAPFGLNSVFAAITAPMQLNAAHAAGDREAMLAAAERYAEGVQHQMKDATPDNPYFDHLFTDETSSPLMPQQSHALAAQVAADLERGAADAGISDDPRLIALLERLRST